jgi:hypothetical protein
MIRSARHARGLRAIGVAVLLRRSFKLHDRVEIETGSERIVFHIDPAGVVPAMDAGASLLARAHRQDQEGGR